MDRKEPGGRYFFAVRKRLFVGAGMAEEEICRPGQPVDGLIGGNMVDDVNPDAAFLKSLPDGRNLRRLFMFDPSSGKNPDGNIAPLHEKYRIGRGENNG